MYWKRLLEQFFFASGLCLLSRCLATMRGNTDRPTDSPSIQQRRYRKRRLRQFFVSAGMFLLSSFLVTIRCYTYRHTDWWKGYTKYAVKMGSDGMIYIRSFIKIGWVIQKLIQGDTQTTYESHKPFIFLQNKESRRPALKADSLTVICELIGYKMWEPQRLTILLASMACCRDSFISVRLKTGQRISDAEDVPVSAWIYQLCSIR
jgi:hypothetical protein